MIDGAVQATLKVTVTVWAVLFIVKLQVVLPLAQPELIVYPDGTFHVPMVDPETTVAVSVSAALLPKLTLQVPDPVPSVLVQFNWFDCVGLDVLATVPLPVPAKAIITPLSSVNVVCAVKPDD